MPMNGRHEPMPDYLPTLSARAPHQCGRIQVIPAILGRLRTPILITNDGIWTGIGQTKATRFAILDTLVVAASTGTIGTCVS
jgi:hypothetical protein